MSSKACLLACTIIAATVTLALAKSLESPDQDVLQRNSLEYQPDDALENALVRYLLTKEWLSRVRQPLEMDERQKKRGYWKQCAFNAVSCFGK